MVVGRIVNAVKPRSRHAKQNQNVQKNKGPYQHHAEKSIRAGFLDRRKENTEMRASKLRVGDVVSVERRAVSDDGQSATTALFVGTVVSVNTKEQLFTISKSSDDKELELKFAECKIFLLFHERTNEDEKNSQQETGL